MTSNKCRTNGENIHVYIRDLEREKNRIMHNAIILRKKRYSARISVRGELRACIIYRHKRLCACVRVCARMRTSVPARVWSQSSWLATMFEQFQLRMSARTRQGSRAISIPEVASLKLAIMPLPGRWGIILCVIRVKHRFSAEGQDSPPFGAPPPKKNIRELLMRLIRDDFPSTETLINTIIHFFMMDDGTEYVARFETFLSTQRPYQTVLQRTNKHQLGIKNWVKCLPFILG